MFVPTLAALYAVDQHVAQGTSLAAMVPTTIVAAVAHGRAGRIDWPLAGAVGAGGIIGGLAGAELALRLDPLLLRRLFAGVLVLVAIRMLAASGSRSICDRQKSSNSGEVRSTASAVPLRLTRASVCGSPIPGSLSEITRETRGSLTRLRVCSDRLLRNSTTLLTSRFVE